MYSSWTWVPVFGCLFFHDMPRALHYSVASRTNREFILVTCVYAHAQWKVAESSLPSLFGARAAHETGACPPGSLHSPSCCMTLNALSSLLGAFCLSLVLVLVLVRLLLLLPARGYQGEDLHPLRHQPGDAEAQPAVGRADGEPSPMVCQRKYWERRVYPLPCFPFWKAVYL